VTNQAPRLAYCARSLAAPDVHVRDIASAWDLALELADDGELDEDFWRRSGVEIATVQAWWLHEAHPLHPDPLLRERAGVRILETLELAERLGAPRMLAVCGFGDHVADRPFERCVDFFAAIAQRAQDAGLIVLLEPLSPRRCSAMWEPAEIVRLAAALERPDVFRLCLDTGHLVDSGYELDAFFDAFGEPVDELQLKGPRSAPPEPTMPVGRWIAALPAPPSVLSAEHNKPLPPGGLAPLIHGLRAQL
jgi:sugar phosphate isomerase/epimerase